MAKQLTQLERRMLRYDGIPAERVAVLERRTVHEVLDMRADLRMRGAMPARPGTEAAAAPRQLAFAIVEDLAHIMRSNRSPAL